MKNIKKTEFKNDNYILCENESEIAEERIKYITFSIFQTNNGQNETVLALYTTKHGGYSEGDSKGLNLKFELDKSKENVIKNYKLLADIFGVSYENFTMSEQVHETNIMIVKEQDLGKGISMPKDYTSVDGIVTNLKGVPLVTVYADCTPIYIYDKDKKVIGMAHAGWRGTVKGIAGKIVDTMINSFNSNPSDLLVAIGPSICMDCYEVSDDVIESIKTLCKTMKIEINKDMINDNKHVDLKEVNRQVLISKNVKDENICVTNLCTKCRDDLFYSHRTYGFKRGSQAGIMVLL